jgi:hypothetical protein
MDEDFLNQIDQRWIKSGDLIVDLSSFQNGFQKKGKNTAKKYVNIFNTVKA